MGGTVIQLGETFNFPDGARMKYPHDPAGGAAHSIGCRCVAIHRVKLPKDESPAAARSQESINEEIDASMKAGVISKGRSTNKETLSAYDAKTGKRFASNDGEEHFVSFTDDLVRVIEDGKNSVTMHHNHPSSRTFSRQDLAMVGQYPGLKVLYAHGHDGASYKVTRRKSFKASDLDNAHNEVARPFIRFEKRFSSKEDHVVLFQHAFIARMGQKKFVDYADLEPGMVMSAYERNKDIFEAIMGSLK
jgi:hypothetical protein